MRRMALLGLAAATLTGCGSGETVAQRCHSWGQRIAIADARDARAFAATIPGPPPSAAQLAAAGYITNVTQLARECQANPGHYLHYTSPQVSRSHQRP